MFFLRVLCESFAIFALIVSFPAHPIAESETAIPKEVFSTVVLPSGYAEDVAVKLALEHLRETAKDELGVELGVKEKSAGGALVVENNADENLSDEGFRIKYAGGSITIEQNSAQAAAHALFFIADQLRIDPTVLIKEEIVRKPAFKFRMASGCSPEDAARWGYNAVLMRGASYNRAVFLDDFDPGLFSGRQDYIDEINAARDHTNEMIDRSKALHLAPVSSGDEFEFHRAVLGRPYRKKLTRTPDDEFLCFCSDTLWEMYAAKHREVQTDFPDIDFTMVRLGENYAKGNYFGNVTTTGEFWQLCTKCAKIGYEDRVATIVNRTADIVVKEFEKNYIHRSWETHDRGFHSDPEAYKKIIDKIDVPENFYISVKYTATDFWRYNFPNLTIGIPGPKQIVEFQCQREYEGKGAYPNFIGEEAAEAYKYIRDKGAAGAWNWLHGGGWHGPEVKLDWWNEANIYATSRLAWEPDAPAEQLAREWAALRFGRENAEQVAKILLMSDDAVLKLVYFEEYAKRKQSKWMPNENWVRDDEIKGADRLMKIYQLASDKVDEMIAEKDEGVRIVEEMLAIAESLDLPEEKKTFLIETIRYELLLGRALRNYAAAFFYFHRWKDAGNEEDKKKCVESWRAWDENWKKYSEEIPRMKLAATAYRDNGMAEAMREISESF
ncbi:MAG: hypothetical protein ABIH66_00795 [bacterium]